MKKKTIANLTMCGIIAVIVTAGVLTVGYIRGWFDKADEKASVLTDIRGVIRMERDGVSYPVEGETVLRAGDRITAESGAAATVRIGNDYFAVGSGAKLEVHDPSAESFHAEVTAGEVFVNTVQTIKLTFDSREIVISNAVAALSVRSGAQTVSVFCGTVGSVPAGQAAEYVDGNTTIAPMQLDSLNEFTIDQIRVANEITTLCYSNADLDGLDAKRQQALQDLINSMTPTVPEQKDPTAPDPTAPSGNDPTEPSADDPTKPSDADPTEPQPTDPVVPSTDPTEPDPTVSSDTTPTDPTDTEPTDPTVLDPTESTELKPTEPKPTDPKPTDPPAFQPVGSCYITIRCDTILDNMDALAPGKAEFVPADGMILPVVEVPFYQGETVFEVLKRACGIAGIQLEYSWTPLYDSYYIEGINNLYEFDCGNESGWMYKVNEWFPNYGCSSYPLEDGDVIVWCYTCTGLGTDVGGPEWME